MAMQRNQVIKPDLASATQDPTQLLHQRTQATHCHPQPVFQKLDKSS